MEPVRLTPLPNGPVQITGAVEVVRHDGEPIEPPTSPVYLCRCGRSANKPFCDGTHARTGWQEQC